MNEIYLAEADSRLGFSTTKVSAPIMRPVSIQSLAGLPLNKKAVAMIANAQTSDQTMGDVPSFLKSGFILPIVASFAGHLQSNRTQSLPRSWNKTGGAARKRGRNKATGSLAGNESKPAASANASRAQITRLKSRAAATAATLNRRDVR